MGHSYWASNAVLAQTTNQETHSLCGLFSKGTHTTDKRPRTYDTENVWTTNDGHLNEGRLAYAVKVFYGCGSEACQEGASMANLGTILPFVS